MKRKVALLALPLVLAALMLGVKWRAEHPTPTKEDLEIRALMEQASKVEVEELPGCEPYSVHYGPLSKDESKLLIDSLNSISDVSRTKEVGLGLKGIVTVKWLLKQPRVDGLTSVNVEINNNSHACYIIIQHQDRELKRYDLHPTTTVRWVDLLTANPRIGHKIKRLQPDACGG